MIRRLLPNDWKRIDSRVRCSRAFLCAVAMVILWGCQNRLTAQADPTLENQPTLASTIDANETKEELLQRLVTDLSSSQFLVREHATERIATEFDEKLLPSLQKAADETTDPEATVRLNSIISRLKAERLQNQIRGFRRARDPKETFGFEGWLSFSRYAGTGRNAKELFLKLLDQFPELVRDEIKSKEEALAKAKRAASIIGESFGALQPPGPEASIGLIYCIAACEDKYDKDLERICLRTFKYFEFRQMLVDAKFKKCLEPMLSSWALKVQEDRAGLLFFLLETDLPVSHDVALGLLDSPEAVNEEMAFLLAMQTLFRFGVPGDLPKVEQWLKDKTECASYERLDGQQAQIATWTIERRDAALVTAMRIAGDDVQIAFPKLVPHRITGFAGQSIFLPKDNDDERTKRIEDWMKGRKQNKNTGA
jgi:hypothetical protein